MGGDELYQPLGQPPAARPPGRFGPVRVLAGGVVLIALVAAGSFAVWRKGEGPADRVAAVAPIKQAPVLETPAVPPVAPAPAAVKALSGTQAETESGVTVVRPSGAVASPGTFIPVPQPDTLALPPAPDARVAEPTRGGILPRRGSDGSRPAEVYARPAGPEAQSGKPRLALFVGGMGLNAALTSAAAQALPPAISLGFAPYGGDLGDQVARARALGHETVLQVPMESFNAPDGTAMPHLLITGAPRRETLDNLHWQMSRLVGYAGVSSFLGAKFTADADAFTPVLKELGDRGLFYFDDGTAPRNVASSTAPKLGLPVVKADIVIDALGDPETIEASLRKLEKLAQSKGVAVGATTGLPNAVDRVAAFAARLGAEGIVLVPVSSIAMPQPAAATRQ